MKWNLPPNNKKTHKSKNRSALYKKQSLVVKNLFFFSGVGICVCLYRVHLCVQVHMEARRQPRVSLLKSCLLHFPETVFRWSHVH